MYIAGHIPHPDTFSNHAIKQPFPIITFQYALYIFHSLPHSICISLFAYSTPYVFHYVCVPLRMCSTTYVFHYVCVPLYLTLRKSPTLISHSVYIPHRVSHSVSVRQDCARGSWGIQFFSQGGPQETIFVTEVNRKAFSIGC